MLKKILGAAVILSAAVATPALAEVIQEPGAYAFYHPNGDLGLGSSRPADAMAARSVELVAEMFRALADHERDSWRPRTPDPHGAEATDPVVVPFRR